MARVVSLVSLALASNAALNNRPIVGIAGVPNDLDPSAGTAWIPASYVKYIEAAGARVVPIPYDAPLSTTLALLKNINGVLFTGGSDDFFTANGSLTTYALTAQAIFKESVDAAAQGETWPLWGTCLGFQILGVAGSDFSRTVLTSGWDSENISLPVKFTAAAASSRVFGSAPGVVNTYATQSVALNAHHDGISPAAFAASGPLSSRFTVLATSVDRKGAEFVASFEGNTLPIYATQWHPEKQIWEWNANEDFVHTYDSIQANRYLADFFVSALTSDSSFVWNREYYYTRVTSYHTTSRTASSTYTLQLLPVLDALFFRCLSVPPR